MTMVHLTSVVCIVLLFLGWQAHEATSNPITVAIEVINAAQEIYEGAKKVREFFKPALSPDDQKTPEELIVFDDLNKIIRNIEDSEYRIVSELSKTLYDIISAKTDKLYEIFRQVDDSYKAFHKDIKNINRTDPERLKSFSESILSPDFGQLKTKITDMHHYLISNDVKEQKLLDILSKQKVPELMCRRNQPPQQIISVLYETVITTDLKALAMKLMALQVKLSEKNNTSYDYYSEKELEEFNERIQKTYDETIKYMSSASREFWKCDPENHVKGKSYSKLQEVFQAIVAMEKDTDEDTCQYGYCYQLNPQIRKTRLSYRNNSHHSHSQPEKLRCSGHIADCKSTGKSVAYCVAPPDDDRRYLGMHTPKKYGDYKENCDNHGEVTEKTTFPLLGFICQVCLCTCISNKLDIDRYFSLNAAVSDWENGMVITGVRLANVNHVFYIEIEQGHLLENGTIDEESLKWIRIPKDTKVDFDKIKHAHYHSINEHGDFPTNTDVYSVNWEQKTVFLDDIEAKSPDEDLVLTGLQFRQQDDALMLQIRLSPFNYKTGQILDEGDWVYNHATTKQRTRLELGEADYPFKKEMEHFIDSHNGQFLKFTVTNLEADMGQFTVPFLDIQEVKPRPATPFVGAGLYHKGLRTGRSGGLLGLKLIQYPFAKHL